MTPSLLLQLWSTRKGKGEMVKRKGETNMDHKTPFIPTSPMRVTIPNLHTPLPNHPCRLLKKVQIAGA